MHPSQPLKAKVLFTIFLAVTALAVGTFAYKEPFGVYPANTQEPIDISTSNQAKTGSLSVDAFYARGNADFKQDLEIDGVAQGCPSAGCLPGATAPSTITVASNVLATGDLKAGRSLVAKSLVHTQSTAQPVCANEQGIIVFCPGPFVPPPPVDVCPDNIAGNPSGVQTAHPDIEVDASGKCTQTIRATILAGQYANAARNMAGNAELANLWIKKITVTSVGGVATSTWPSSTPLRFRWSYCSAWNPNYSGPGVGSGAVFFNVQPPGLGSGYCADFRSDYAYGPLPYGFSGRQSSDAGGGYNGIYVGYDGVTQVPNTFNGVAYPKGFFDATQYDLNGSKTTYPPGYTVNLWYQKNHGNDDNYANIKRPLKKLILNNMKVPAGYKLTLTTAPESPGTIIETHLAP